MKCSNDNENVQMIMKISPPAMLCGTALVRLTFLK